jgi:D-alanyl-D-alanine carboxypeptidase/D-alanyl-D-alanine-endopeptidase (penicillin-binding protein 4)
MYTRLTRLRPFAVILVFSIAASLALEVPVSATTKTRQRSSSKSKRTTKKKGKVTAQSRRSKKYRSRKGRLNARSRGKVRYTRVRVRGKNGRWYWRRRPVVSASVHGVGVHNYLTDAWTNAQNPSERTTRQTVTEMDVATGNTMSANRASGPQPGTGSARTASSETRPREVTGPDEAPPVNPLVEAYAESLEARGIPAENQGFIVARLNGEVLAEHNADRLFNPASVTKVATSLTVISRLGPDFRFKTNIYTDGALDPTTGILHGSLYVIGSGDPAFFAENALLITDKLNRSGIKEIDGNLVVLGQFYFNFSASRDASAKAFRGVITAESTTAATKSAYARFLAMRGAEDRAAVMEGRKPAPQPSTPPKIKISGQTITDSAVNTPRLSLVAVHTSLPLVRLLKGLNDFSNNWMASVVGNLVGGPDAVERFLMTDVGFKTDEVNFATSSGLGSNSISPRGTVNILRKLIVYLNSKGLQLEDILPIAGVDAGTLEKRFTDAFRGSVVGKTGTLSGVSALAGVAYTRGNGPLLFVIFNHGRSAHAFRPIQDETIKKVITLYGGPAPVRNFPSLSPRVSERGAEGAGQGSGSK